MKIKTRLRAKGEKQKGKDQNRGRLVFGLLPLAFCLLFSLLACSKQDTAASSSQNLKNSLPMGPPAERSAQPIILSILPVESAAAMYTSFLPLKYHLEKILNAPIIIRIAKDYESAIDDIGTGQVHMAYLDPAAYCEVRARYGDKVTPLVRAIGKQGTSRSVLVAKRGGSVNKLVDVFGKRLALGNRHSSFSYLIPLAMLNDVGVGIKDLASVDYLQQEDTVALSVLIGNYDVGAMSEPVAAKYSEDGLEIIKRSEMVPQFVLCASSILPAEKRNAVIRGLVSQEGRETLLSIDRDMDKFITAEDRDFDMVRVMIKNLTGRDLIEYGPRTIKVAVLPLYSAITMYERYEPLMRYLSQKTGYEFKLVIPRDFKDFIKMVKGGKVDFSYQNPYIFALIERDKDITPLVTTIGEDSLSTGGVEGGDSFRGVIITRTDSPIREVTELRNKKVLITSPKSAGGYLSQRLFLLNRGIDTEKDLKIIDAKRQENVILGVYRGEADAGFVRESALVVLKDAVDMKKIRVLSRTKPLPNWPFALCGKVSPPLADKVMRLLSALKDREILKVARIKGFKTASAAEFQALKKY